MLWSFSSTENVTWRVLEASIVDIESEIATDEESEGLILHTGHLSFGIR